MKRLPWIGLVMVCLLLAGCAALRLPLKQSDYRTRGVELAFGGSIVFYDTQVKLVRA